jgi:hypothetical protein
MILSLDEERWVGGLVASGSLLLSEQCPGGKTDLSHPEKSLTLQQREIFPFNLFELNCQYQPTGNKDCGSFGQFSSIFSS